MINSDKVIYNDRPQPFGVKRGDNINSIINKMATAIENPFNPGSLPNIWAWWKADAGVTGTPTATGWADNTAFGRNLVFDVAGPTIIPDALNGYPVLKGGKMVTTTNMALINNLTIYIVGKQERGDSVAATFLQSSNYLQIGRNEAIGTNLIGGQVQSGDPSLYAGKDARNNTFYTIRFRADNTKYYMALNGSEEISHDRIASVAAPSVVSLFNNGDKTIAEVLIYLNNHTEDTRALVEKYLKHKYKHY